MKSSASELGVREYSITVSTCLPQLRLLVCDSLAEDYDVFKEQMNLAVLGSAGFGDL